MQKRILGQQSQDTVPGEFWGMDFTELKPALYGCKHLLVLVVTIMGWAEAFPSLMAQVVAKKLIMENILRFGFLVSLGSDNDLTFTAKFSQLLSKSLNIDWKLYCIYEPQSSGKIERMNRTLKDNLITCTLETGAN